MGEQKERLYYLDVLRVIAMLAVLLGHFSIALEFVGAAVPPNTMFDVRNHFGINQGSFGVTIFFVVSGASLMYTYGDKLDIKKYFKKRFLGIYPMFWIAWILGFLFLFYKNQGFTTDLPFSKMWMTVTAMDGYLGWYGPNFYILGEWFLGCIILLYLVFPLIKWAMEKAPIITAVVILAMYLGLPFIYKMQIPAENNFIFRIPEFAMGMYYVKYRVDAKWYMALPAAGILTYFYFGNTSFIPLLYKYPIISLCLMVVIAFLCKVIKSERFFRYCKDIGKYGYAVFLCHHVIVGELSVHFFGCVFTRVEVYTLVALYFLIVAFFSKLLYKLNKSVIDYI